MRGLLLSFVISCCLLAYPAGARPVRVYEVDVAERSGTALQGAMREALMRATGRREAVDDPALSAIIDNAQRYVQSYTTGPRGESQVVFDAAAVNAAIEAAGRSVWDSDRPFTLVVLDPPRPRAQADAARIELERVAMQRGLPISVVPLALNDATGKPLAAEALHDAAQKYGADALLVGHEGSGPNPAWQWTFYGRTPGGSWTGSLAAGIDQAVDHLVPQQASSAAQAESTAQVQVDNVRSLTDYANVSRLLAATPGVRRVGLASADATSLVFTASVRGGASGLEQALAAAPAHLTHTATSGVRTVFRYQP